MLATIFTKSNPLNYLLVVGLLIFCFFAYQLGIIEKGDSIIILARRGGLLLMLIASLFITGFVTKRNELSSSSYSILFFLTFLILFPTVLLNQNLIISSFFVFFALRRLMSLRSLISPKEKIFDASIYICIASIFHFWSILFILLVFISIILHVSRDYRNWLLPYVAFFVIAVIYITISIFFDKTLIGDFLLNNVYVDFNFNYFTSNIQNVAISIYAAFTILFLFSQIISLPGKPLILHPSYKKVIFAFLIGVAVFVVSPHKSNDILIYTLMPSAIMGTSYMEGLKVKWFKELILILIVTLCFVCFFLQL